MIEYLDFFNSVSSNKWISLLWSELKKVREEHEKELEKELDDINKIMFGDPVELAKYYVEPDCQEMNPANLRVEDEMVTKQPVMVKIDQFLKQPAFHHGSNQLFILSDAGMGKSALLTMLKLMHLTRFWPQDRACVLRKLGRGSIDEIKDIKNQRKTILLLDSLDEDPRAYGRVRNRLLDILKASQDFAKVIITCRTQFFPPSEKHELELPGQVCVAPYRCYSKYLSFFNNQKVYNYLSKRFPKRFFGLLTNKKNIEEAKNIIAKMGNLRCRPMLLSYIEDLMTLTSTAKYTSEYRIFDALLDSWLRREQTKKPDIVVDDLYDACTILAVWMQMWQKRAISEDELDKLIGEISLIKKIKEIEMKGRSLLNRNSDGDYRFSHFSIQEFCVAKFISKKPIFEPKEKILITDAIIRMIGMSKKIDPEAAKMVQIGQPENIQEKITKFGMEFVYIPPGIFMMGSPETESDRHSDETPHMVILTNGFYLQTTLVTQKQWESLMDESSLGIQKNWDRIKKNVSMLGDKSSPEKFGNGERPISHLYKALVEEFIKLLNDKEGKKVFRLPTEAEWEYACRAGTKTKYYTGDTEADLDRAGWYKENSNGHSHPVGEKEPNGFGLYDMHGNVYEFCQEYHNDYPEGIAIDPFCEISKRRGSALPLQRGGSWKYGAKDCRAARRGASGGVGDFEDKGFRLVLLPGK